MVDPVPAAGRKIAVDSALEAAVRQLEAAITEQEQAADRIISLVEFLLEDEKNLNRAARARCEGIMDACGFQDVTGQRITKVIRFLRHVAKEVHVSIPAPATANPMVQAPQEKPAAGLTQEQVDRLLRGEKV